MPPIATRLVPRRPLQRRLKQLLDAGPTLSCHLGHVGEARGAAMPEPGSICFWVSPGLPSTDLPQKKSGSPSLFGRKRCVICGGGLIPGRSLAFTEGLASPFRRGELCAACIAVPSDAMYTETYENTYPQARIDEGDAEVAI